MKQTTTTRLVTLGISLCLMLSYSLSAQMTNGLYGNEWIDFDRSYFKVTLSEDGIYRINRSALESAGIPVASVRGEQFRLIWLGEEVPIYTTTNGIFGSGDFIEFYGRKNRSEFDRVLFENPDEELLNPDYSMFTDQSAYYLTWEDAAGGLRVQDQANDISNPPAKETHFSYTHLELFTISGQDNKSFHVKRTINGDGGAFSYFDVAEGFGSEFATGHTVIIAPRHVYGADNASSMRVRFASDNLLHRQTVSLNGDLLFDETFTNFTVQDHTFDINTSDITSTARVQLRGIDSSVDRLSIASIRLTYPRFFNFDNNSTFQFEIAAANTEKYLEIKKFDLSDGGNVLLYDLTNNFRLQAVVDGDVVKVVLPPSSEDRQLVLMNVGKDLQERTPQRVEFIDYSKQPEADYFIITHKSLFDDGRGNNYVQQYADYRASQIGGDFKVMIVEIGQLYDQFAYGVETHPLSIRNFGHFIDSIMPAPRYAFIIGKGREYSEIRREEDKVGEEDLPLLVPTYGIPGSDAMLFSDGRSPISRIPVGRLAANNGQEVNLYLKKVKAFEANVNLPQTIEDRAWMKRIIHLGGGGTQEQALIRNNLEGMENIIETNLFGGEVTGFYKNSSDPVQISTSEQIFNLINGGVSMITFFGHSGANTFDFNIDNPDNYRNKDKYPLMFSLGCHIGNIHTHFQGVSERFTFDEDAGAIGFGASSSLGFIFALNRFSRSFYDLLGGEMYGASIGDIQKETVRRLFPSAGNGMLELLQQFTFHADPAIRMNPAPGPDYVVDPESVKFEPGLINAQLDEFDLSFTVMNIGRAIEDSIVIRIEQQFPDGSTVVPVLQKIAAPAFKTDLTLSIPVYGRNSVGQNKLFITVDATNEVEEVPAFSAESNNELVTTTGKGIPFFVIDNGVLQLYPKEYAIVGDSDISLLSSTLNALSPSQKFFIEIDTTALFNSPLKRSEEITQEGGIIRWKPQMNWTDETVYYWRVSPDSTNAQIGFVWENSSFLYLSGAGDGWNQSHYFQYLDSRFDNMTLDSASRAFTFGDDIKDVRMINKVWDPDNPPQYFNDNSPWRSPFSWTINEGVQVMVRRDRTLRYWLNTREGLYGSINGKGQIVPFPYHTNTEDERADLMTLLEDVIPDGDYVILYTVLRSTASDFSPELWAQDSTSYGKNIFSLLEEQGATQVRRMKDLGSVPYVLIYKKGEGVLAERIGESIEDIVSVDIGLPSSLFEGQINSTLVGPASKWTSLQWQLTDQPNPQADTASIHIYGVDESTGLDTLLFSGVTDASFDLDQVDANIYPNLRLVFNAKDDIDRTSPGLNHWRVLYDGLPDAAVNPNALFVTSGDSIQQGDQFDLNFALENVSQYDLDSLLIRYQLQDDANNVLRFERKIAPLAKWATTETGISLDTRQLRGTQQLTIAVNPDRNPTENTYLNNFIISNFKIEQDIENPILDVTFDGIHILDGDVVSPQPDIFISLKDENPFLELGDTSLFRIFLNLPDGSTQRVTFNQPNINFLAASGADNKATIEFNPTLELDGRYELLVQAEDATGNQSGDLDYKVSFEVVNRRSLSNVLNYPNPFSTSTQFVYTLTGDEVPDYFKIQIFTVGGRIVKEITQDEIGMLKIGTHRTDYAWDGRDDFGNRLANGVYLYRIVAKDADGQPYEQFTTSADRFFKNGFGKLVILR